MVKEQQNRKNIIHKKKIKVGYPHANRFMERFDYAVRGWIILSCTEEKLMIH